LVLKFLRVIFLKPISTRLRPAIDMAEVTLRQTATYRGRIEQSMLQLAGLSVRNEHLETGDVENIPPPKILV